MKRNSTEISRRALLGAVCAAPVLSHSRHSGLDPESTFFAAEEEGRWIPDQARDDEQWDEALARFHEAQATLDAAKSEPDEDVYDALLDIHSDALSTLLALPAPDLPAFAAKLDIIVPQLAWELTGSEDCLEILRQDAHRLAAAAA
jgi:hypothetical protein